MSTKNERVLGSLSPLANATELVVEVVKNVAGNDVANTLNGSPITSDTLRTLIASRIKRNLENRAK